MSTLENIIQSGNRSPLNHALVKQGRGCKRAKNEITCKDGFMLSVIAGDGTYCDPRPNSFDGMVPATFSGPFFEVEVGFPSERPEPWDLWKDRAENAEDPTGTVYAYVPVQAVRDLVALHGGEA